MRERAFFALMAVSLAFFGCAGDVGISTEGEKGGRAAIEEAYAVIDELHDNEADHDVVNGVHLSEDNPSTFVIDREGRILSYHLGFQDGDELGLEKEITDLLAPTGGCG
jgi:hypothetical protein